MEMINKACTIMDPIFRILKPERCDNQNSNTASAAQNKVYNVACHERTTLNELNSGIRTLLAELLPSQELAETQFRDFREGDVFHLRLSIAASLDVLRADQ